MTVVAKAATPEQLSWRARIIRYERPLRAVLLAWMAGLRAEIAEGQIVAAIVTRATAAFDQVVRAAVLEPDLLPVAEEEALREFREVVHGVDAGLRLSLDLRDPNFRRVVAAHEAAMVREVTDETRRAISNMIARAYDRGVHPDVAAKEIRAAVGLTSRQAQAVLNHADALTRQGVPPGRVADRAMRYADRMRSRRATTIARTETARAATIGRLQSYEQAAAHGLFPRAEAELEWSAVQTDPEEICYQLDGERVPFGGTFDGLLPPAHPNCRCSVRLVLAGRPGVEARVRSRLGL